jgi:hypothetical protein
MIKTTAVVLAAAAAFAQVQAYSSYCELIPNGETLGKSLGHTDDGYTDFGTMFSDAGTEWSAVCSETWPGGAVTVGSALGDPCCTWTEGGTPDFTVSEVPGTDTEGTTCATASTSTASSAAAATSTASSAAAATTTASSGSAAATTTDTTATSTASSNSTATTTDSEDGSYCE